jgi:DNA-directed RNA polymerase specialized sigma24 family protein
MESVGSITCYLELVKAGDEEAARRIWERYFVRLTELVDQRLRGKPWGAFDSEDVALSAFDSFFRAAAGGRFPQLADRDGLWALLLTIAGCKIRDRVQHEHRQRRNVDKVEGGSPALEQLRSREPSPELVAMMADECRRLLDDLGEDTLRQIALLKMEGCTDKEVAAKLNCGLRTVERKLERIRCKWQHEIVR